MPCDAPTPPTAAVMSWPNLRDTEGTAISTTWPALFDTWRDPPRYRGDMKHAGWSACICDPPTRAAANVVAMSALVLDYDNGTTIDAAAGLWGEHYGAIHTSRSHKPDAPRFRVVLPLARNVSPDEYPIVWRWAQQLATSAGQRIDPATKDVARFWYAPGATDAYETRDLTGTPLDPDPILSAHKYEMNERQRAATDTAPRGDVEKRAAKYLAKLPASISGSGGHAALWSAALSLVRGFRIPPERALSMLRTDFNPRCQPPWTERELRHKVDDAEQDATTAYGYLADRVRAVSTPEPPPDVDPDYVPEVPESFSDDAPQSTAPRVAAPSEWRAQLSTDQRGNVRKTFDNLCRILEHHDNYGARLRYNEMRLTPMLDGRAVSDADVGRIRRDLEQHFGIQPGEPDVRAALLVVSDGNRYHPVRQYLTGLDWDNTPRIGRVVVDILGAADTPLHQAMVRNWFVSAVARAITPGCKVDTSLVLVGKQRARKSSFFAVLGGEWFADTHMNITDKDGLLQLHSAWIYEWAEIEGITTTRRADDVKRFASSASDTFREPFGRAVGIHRRSTVIVGTSNEEQLLTDPTGSRRFNIIRTADRVQYELAAEWRDQLWAEAVALHAAGVEWWLSDAHESDRERAAVDFTVEDSWEEPIEAWLASKPPVVTTSRLLDLAVNIPAGQRNKGAENRVGSIMRRLGYVMRRRRDDGSILRLWVKA